MWDVWSRRGVLAALGASAFIRPARADQGLLEKLRKQGSIKVAVANNMPWSTLNPDGTLSGIAPTIVTTVLSRLNIPKIEGVVATYGELVPGLLAGRWDMIGASLTITPERCAQVAYADPFYRKKENSYIGYIASDMPNPPKSMKEVADRFDRIGLTTGSWSVPVWQTAVAAGKKGAISQFPDPSLMIDGLMTKRVQIVSADAMTMQELKRLKPGIEIAAIEMPIVDRGSGAAFRKDDTDLRDAFVREFRAMKKSGEAAKILAAANFEYDAEYMDMSGEAACSL